MRSVFPGRCPLCDHDIEYRYQTETIPHFSDVLIISSSCPCGFHYCDTLLISGGEPARWQLRVSSPQDLSIRVVRGSSGIIEIPDLGVRIDPGPACEAFISNVEGILLRVSQVVEQLLPGLEGSEKENAVAFLDRIGEVREGMVPVTLVIEDPCGNSAIVSEKAEKIPLPPEET
ncbi:MAG: ZPR1 zinc finger domain-containing protein [Methanomicrobiales archaeon]|nr:ZPR1 zinc finger domain-containing protein [Methanomicrobiales archaeon]